LLIIKKLFLIDNQHFTKTDYKSGRDTVLTFREKMGYKFQFITLADFHALNTTNDGSHEGFNRGRTVPLRKFLDKLLCKIQEFSLG
jgi:hypothetical protein